MVTRIGISVRLLIALLSIVQNTIGSTTSTPEYNVITDGHGAPKLVVKGSNLPVVGHFWLHFPGTDHGNSHQLSAASVDVNGAVKACVIDLNGTNFNFSDWHFIKWILKSNEFTCALISSDRANLTSAPVTLPINDTLTKGGLSYTISPGAGNSDFCLYNVSVAKAQVMDCVHVRKSATTVSSADQQTCDCPTRPPAVLLGHVFDQFQSDGTSSAEVEKTDLKGNTVTAADDRERWRNSSLWLIDFPTPRPFDTAFARDTTRAPVGTTTIGNGTTARTTKVATRLSSLGANGTTTAQSTIGSTSKIPVVAATNSCRPGSDHNRCQNGGTCLQNASSANSFYCNCTIGFHGDFCELGRADNGSEQVRVTSQSPVAAEIKCPDGYCQNGGTCKPTNVGTGNDSARVTGMPSLTCFCTEAFVGQFCSHPNFCYSDNPCQNGGSCSISVPLSENDWATATNETLYRCRCRTGFDGDRCQINAVETSTRAGSSSPPPPSATPNATGPCNEADAVLCKNGGTCLMMDQKVTCHCTSNFTGDYCEKQSSTGELAAAAAGASSNRNVGAIVGGVFGALAFIGLIIGSVFLYRYVQRSRKLKGKYNPAKEEATAAGGNTMTMTTVTTGERLI